MIIIKRNHSARAVHFLCTFLCRLFTFFFTAAHFHLGGRQHFSYSQHCHKIFMFPTKLVPFVFYLSVSSPFSVIHVNVDIKIKSKKRMAFLLFFISKGPGGCAIYRQNARVVEMQNFTPAYMKGWTYVRTIFSEPKFIGCIGNQFFSLMVLRRARFSRREPR